jgi:lipid A ethanolaminephosphotransferase
MHLHCFHVPAVMWFGANFHGADLSALRMKSRKRFTHSNVFHTMLGLFKVESSIYRPGMDMLDGARLHEQTK